MRLRRPDNRVMSVPRGDLRNRSIIVQMVARRTYLGGPWPFEEMTTAELYDLSMAADGLAEPYHRVRELARGWEPTKVEQIEARIGRVDAPLDADEIEWAEALLAELETRRTVLPAGPVTDLEAACSRVRRLIDLGGRPEAQ